MISIIVPIYNAEDYLTECLNSIKNQTYENWECILVDDGSMDNSLDIANEFAKNDSRFQAYHLKNQGVSNARNFGLSKATGDYFSFIDSDDFIDKNMFATLIDKMTYSNADIVQCNYYEYENGAILPNTSFDSDYVVSGEFEIIKETYHGKLNSSVCTKVFRRNLIKTQLFDTDLAYGEDMLFVVRNASKAKKVLICSDSFYYYRIHESSAMHKKITARRLDSLVAFERIKSIFQDNSSITRIVCEGEDKELVNIINLIIENNALKNKLPQLRQKLLLNKKIISKKNFGKKFLIQYFMILYVPVVYQFFWKYYQKSK